jgi:hypothetical protein
MKTVTAVEWLVQEIESLYIGNFNITFLKQIEQAKEMEKQQIIDASNTDKYLTSDFIDRAIDNGNSLGEQYYNDKFNK